MTDGRWKHPSRPRRRAAWVRVVAPALLVAWCGAAVRAHESDQYSVPIGREFADLRLYFSEWVHQKLEAAVEHTNGRIESALELGADPRALESLQSPDTIAWAVLLEFPPVIHFIETVELSLRGPPLQKRYPGLIVGHLPPFWIYHHWALVLDPTKLIRLGRSSTVMIDGVYCGTDKLAHFFHMGYLYFSAYRKARSAGNDEAESEVRAVRLGINSEDSFLGIFTTGVRSNADLAANYMGYLFYRNLTEDVRVNELVRPPLLIREGPYWRINVHVRPNSDFFSVFVSPHWDEALNPNTYAPGMDRWIRQEIRRRCPDLLAWYRDGQGRPRRRGDFLRIMEELATVDGKDYGHQGVPAALVSIANTCFGEAGESSEMVAVARAANREPAAEGADPRGADAFGRTELWHAAAGGDAERVRRCLADGADAGAADLDGETPLHVASRWGHQEIVELLGRRGAPLDARALYGVTPLHLAVRELRIGTVRTLLTLGADARARDIFGCTPLHDAASRGFDAVAILLRSGGADPDAEDVHAATPLHAAARNGRVNMVELLLEWGADAGRKDARGRSAVELLKAAGHKEWGGLRRGRDEEAR